MYTFYDNFIVNQKRSNKFRESQHVKTKGDFIMNFEHFDNILKGGFNAKELANALMTSEGHVNELRRSVNTEGLAKVISDTFHVSMEKAVNVINDYVKKPNTKALYDFALKREINLDAIDLKRIAELKAQRNERPAYEKGFELPNGEIITHVQKVGNSMVYVLSSGMLCSTKDLDKMCGYVEEKAKENA